MKTSAFYILLGSISLAPHTSDWFGIGVAFVYLVLAVIFLRRGD